MSRKRWVGGVNIELKSGKLGGLKSAWENKKAKKYLRDQHDDNELDLVRIRQRNQRHRLCLQKTYRIKVVTGEL